MCVQLTICRMHYAPITCLCLSDDQLIMSGSTSGSITISDPSSIQQVATLRSSDARGNNLSFSIGTLVHVEGREKQEAMDEFCVCKLHKLNYIH